MPRVWSWPHGRAAPRRSLEGRHPRLFLAQRGGELRPPLDPERPVGPREMALDGLDRHVERVGDLAVGAALGGEPSDAQLARRERLDAGAPYAAGPCAGRVELGARA